MSKSYIIAIIIAGIIGGWLISGQLRDQTEATKPAVSIAEQNEEIKLQRVRTRISKAMPHTADVVLRGRTEALRKVHVKAETMGRIIALPPDKGQQVEQGDLLCQLDPQDRTARLAEAKAQVRAASLSLIRPKPLKPRAIAPKQRLPRPRPIMTAPQQACAPFRLTSTTPISARRLTA